MCTWIRVFVMHVVIVVSESRIGRRASLFCLFVCAWRQNLPDDSPCGHVCMDLSFTWQNTWKMEEFTICSVTRWLFRSQNCAPSLSICHLRQYSLHIFSTYLVYRSVASSRNTVWLSFFCNNITVLLLVALIFMKWTVHPYFILSDSPPPRQFRLCILVRTYIWNNCKIIAQIPFLPSNYLIISD